jgi:hypothetical protein
MGAEKTRERDAHLEQAAAEALSGLFRVDEEATDAQQGA